MSFKALRIVALLVAVIAFSPASAVAQPLWLQRSAPRMVSLEVAQASFEDGDALDLSSIVAYLSARTQLSDKLRLVGELPFTRTSYDLGIFGSGSESGIGNPYLGLEFGRMDSPFFAQLGVRVPATGIDIFTAAFAIVADFDRFAAYLPDVFSASGGFNYRRSSSSGLVVHLRAEPNVLLPNEDIDMEDPEFFMGYGALLGYETTSASIMGGLTGLWHLSGGDLDFAESSAHQININGGLWLGNVRPGIMLRLPVDSDLNDALASVIGLSVAVRLR